MIEKGTKKKQKRLQENIYEGVTFVFDSESMLPGGELEGHYSFC